MKIALALLTFPALFAPAGAQNSPDVTRLWRDFDADGLLDLYAPGPDGGTLHRQAEPGVFEDVSQRLGLRDVHATADAAWIDADEDGDWDLLTTGAAGLRLLENRAAKGFVDSTAAAGLEVPGAIRAIGWLDVDGDGRVDLHVAAGDGLLVFRNLRGLAFEVASLELPRIGVSPSVDVAQTVGATTPDEERAGSAPTPAAENDRHAPGRRDATRSAGRRDVGSVGVGGPVGGGTGGGHAPGGGSTSIGPGGGASGASGGLVWADRLVDRSDGVTLLPASSVPTAGHFYPLGADLWTGDPGGEFVQLRYNEASDDLRIVGGAPGTKDVDLLTVNRVTGSVGIGTTQPASELHVLAPEGPADLRIEADPDNDDEFAQPRLRLYQDGGGTVGLVGYLGGTNDLTVANSMGGTRLDFRDLGDLALSGSAKQTTAVLDPDRDAGGALFLMNEAGATRVELAAKEGAGGATLEMRANDGSTTVSLDAEEAEDAVLRLFQLDGTNTVQIAASDAGTGANVVLRADSGQATIRLDADEGGAGDGALRFYNEAGVETVEFHGFDQTWGGAALRLRDAAGTNRIVLNAATGITRTPKLQITGGADIAEPFRTVDEDVLPGYLMCIDPDRPGQLVVSEGANDRRVAGIVSGAGGIEPGLTLSQTGTIADGEVPVALTGRVWCWADASTGAIEPGDRLVTSSVRGHAMCAGDEPVHGAIVGKAMTPLAGGRGLVLVLVNLQ